MTPRLTEILSRCKSIQDIPTRDGRNNLHADLSPINIPSHRAESALNMKWASSTADHDYGLFHQRRSVKWSSRGASLRGVRCYEVPGTINGVSVNALPDWGSTVDAVSEAFASRHGLQISPTKTQSIRLLGGHTADSVGRVVGLFKFRNEEGAYRREFHVLRKSVYDVVLGRGFLDWSKTLTEHFHRVVGRTRPCVRNGNRLFLLDESPDEHLRCNVNGARASAFLDTGSDLMLVSGEFARRNKLRVCRGRRYTRRVELIDGSIIHTDGMVLDAVLELDACSSGQMKELDYDCYLDYAVGLSILTGQSGYTRKETYICDLHVIDDLPCDIILSNEFIFRNRVFSRFRNVLHSRPDDDSRRPASPADSVLFMRNRSATRSLLSRWRRLLDSEMSVELPLYRSQDSDTSTAPAPSRLASSWNERWEDEEARRNRAQLRIAPLPEPQRSVEQRSENYRRAIWDRDNPRPPATASPTSSERALRPAQDGNPQIPSPAVLCSSQSTVHQATPRTCNDPGGLSPSMPVPSRHM